MINNQLNPEDSIAHCLLKTKRVGRAGFEPTKAEPTDLQSAPFDRFGISPCIASLQQNQIVNLVEPAVRFELTTC